MTISFQKLPRRVIGAETLDAFRKGTATNPLAKRRQGRKNGLGGGITAGQGFQLYRRKDLPAYGPICTLGGLHHNVSRQYSSNTSDIIGAEDSDCLKIRQLLCAILSRT